MSLNHLSQNRGQVHTVIIYLTTTQIRDHNRLGSPLLGSSRTGRRRWDPEALWFLIHHSLSDNRRSVVFTCYVDDSGTEKQSKIVVLGGCVLDRENFRRFDDRWSKMLRRYRIGALHMTDFVRPFGKHVGMYPELKIALFTEAVKTINSRKDSSISVALRHAEYKESVPIEVYRKTIGPYGVAFIHLALFNARVAEHHDYPDQIAYLVDEGSAFAEEIRVGHLFVKSWEASNTASVRTGALAFDSDERVSVLQGADVVAWSARRHFSGDGLDNEFTPLRDIFQGRFTGSGIRIHPHFHHWVQDDIGKRTMDMVNSNGPDVVQEAIASLRKLQEIG